MLFLFNVMSYVLINSICMLFSDKQFYSTSIFPKTFICCCNSTMAFSSKIKLYLAISNYARWQLVSKNTQTSDLHSEFTLKTSLSPKLIPLCNVYCLRVSETGLVSRLLASYLTSRTPFKTIHMYLTISFYFCRHAPSFSYLYRRFLMHSNSTLRPFKLRIFLKALQFSVIFCKMIISSNNRFSGSFRTIFIPY